jgi:hypothetical protein
MRNVIAVLLCLAVLPIFASTVKKDATPVIDGHVLRMPNVEHVPCNGPRSTPTVVDKIPLSSINATGYCWGIAYDWERDCLWITQWNSSYNKMYAIQKTSPCVKVDSVTLGSGVPAYRLGIGYGGSDVMYMAGYDGQIYAVDMTTGTASVYRATPWSADEGLGFNAVDDAVYVGDWSVDLCAYAQPAQTGSWTTWSLSSVSGLSGAHSASVSPQWLFTANEDASQAHFYQHSLSGGVPNLVPDSVWDLPAGMTQASTADCAFDGQYIYIVDQMGPDTVWVFDVGITPPLTVWDFETGLQGWTHTNGLPFPYGWDVEPSGYYPAWTPPDAGDSTMWIDSDASGSGTWVQDTTMSPVVVPPPNMGYLKYGVGYNWISSGEFLEVGLKYFNGSSWSVVALKTYTEDTGPMWDSVDVSAYGGYDSIQVYFYYDDNNIWAWYLAFDNVGLLELPAHDVGVTSILEPVGTYSINDVVNPAAQVKNFGDFDDNFPVIFMIEYNSTPVYADTVTVSLASGEIDTAYFDPYTFTQAGVFDIVSYSELAGDANPANDTAYASASVFEWVEDFEASNGGYVADPATGAWQWGVPTSGPGAAHSGTNVWATMLAGQYLNNANWKLTTQDDYIATQDNPHMLFYHWYDIEDYYDGGNVKYSTDGVNWILLHPLGGYDDEAYSGNAGIPAESCYCGHPMAWEPEEIIIPVTSGQTFKLRFHFGTDASVTYTGWYIDDLAGLGFNTGINEEPGTGQVAVFGFAPSMSTVHRDHVPISYSTTVPSHVSLKVYDNMGRLVRTLVDAQQPAGEKSVLWDNKDLNKRTVPNGVYFLKLSAEGKDAVHKLILVK